MCRRITSADTGRLLENLVFMELRRRGFDVFYFEEKRECDFILRIADNRLSAIQVSFELNKENTEREVGGLIEACRQINIKEGLILTNDEETVFEQEGITIKVFPIWRWLLEFNP